MFRQALTALTASNANPIYILLYILITYSKFLYANLIIRPT